jgi:alanine-synthesizing transaminase
VWPPPVLLSFSKTGSEPEADTQGAILMRFSTRTNWDTEESNLARAHRERLAAGLPLCDLTASNPTRCGFDHAADLLEALTDPAALDYDPDPKGMLSARQAVSAYYADHGAAIDPANILLATSTSEAYSYLFKLLCDPGEAILAAQPSYPLFDFLATAESLTLLAAPLIYDHGWQLDLEGLRQAITPKTRAIVVVHPNNPTGHFTKVEESKALAGICREHGLALIVDEVFLDYGFGSATEDSSFSDRSSFAVRDLPALVFVVSGISKICGLPQMKSAWLAALGPRSAEAMARLEVIADTFLSMNAPVQRALPEWLEGRSSIQNQIRERTRTNLAALDEHLTGQDLVSRLEVEGGWYAILRVPALHSGEEMASELLELGVWVHPGSFFGMSASGWLVVSLLTRRMEFSDGIAKLIGYFRQNQESYLSD